MNRPPPAPPPKRYDLVESFNALALAGKQDDSKKLPRPPVNQSKSPNSFVGGFSPERLLVNAALDSARRPPLVPPTPHGRPEVPGLLPRPPLVVMPMPQVGQHSLTMQHALDSMASDTPTKQTRAPPPPARLLSPPAMAEPSISAAGPPRPALNVTPSRPRAASSPPSSDSATSSTGKNTLQCSSMTKAGKQCLRQVKLPSTHSYLDPVPVLYCHQHREAMITAQTGFYVRRKGHADRFVEFSDYVPAYLQIDTQLALRAEMEKAASSADVPGYIYTYEIRDPTKPNVIQLKVGRAVNLNKRLYQWDKQCGSKVQIVRGWWPGTVDDEDEDGANGSLLKGHIKAGEAGPLCHRVERLVHIELADLSLHAPYMEPDWPKFSKRDDSPSDKGSRSPSPKKATLSACSDCGVMHKEIFAIARPEKGRYKGREWDMIVKPVIEKWGTFIKEYYA